MKRLVAVLALAGTSAAAQSPAASVRGMVYDSIAHAPLAGAVVQIVVVDSTAKPGSAEASPTRGFTAVTGSDGRYRITGLPQGMFAIGFQHDALNVMRLESPLRAFRVGTDTLLTINLAIPDGKQVLATSCPSGGPAADGMLAGFVRDATAGTALAGAKVTLGWTEIGVEQGKLGMLPKRMVVPVEEDGTYLACGLASESPLTLSVAHTGYRDVLGEITIPAGSAARRDFRLADTSAAHGGVHLAGRVVHADGAVVASGQASIAALDLDASVEQGAFSLSSVPAGTWLVEARVLGYEPTTTFVDVAEGAPAAVTLTVNRKVQLLETVNVVGKPSRDIKVLSEIAERRRTSAGTVFMPGNSWLETALTVADVARAARGFRILAEEDTIEARGCLKPGQGGMNVQGAGPPKVMGFRLNGQDYPLGFAELKNEVRMRDILAVEMYSSEQSIPIQWRRGNLCALVVVWTKR